ncbi:cell wall hydrolase [Pelagibius sp.]|uniref:cell wall hydrolase n=1 Tax=Pelagibius sp. TaxID=1931238 RepID=UPI003B5073CD
MSRSEAISAPRWPNRKRWLARARRGWVKAGAKLGFNLRGLSAGAVCSAVSAPIACVIAGAALAHVATSDSTESAWTRVTAQSFIPVDVKDIDPDFFFIRQVGLRQLDLEEQLASVYTPDPGNLRDELTCLAQNIYFEARSEPLEGQLAVAHVVMNRVASRNFPETVCDVVRDGTAEVLHKCQFSWYCDGKEDLVTDMTAWAESERLASKVYWGRVSDNTGGALWYHADYVSPSWRKAFVRGPKIGLHIFYSRKPAPAPTQVAQTD